MVVTILPLLSSTLTITGTRRDSAVNVISSWAGGGVGGACAIKSAGSRKRLLSRRIIPGAENCLELRKSRRLYQLNGNTPVFPVARRVFGRIAQNVFISQLDADLC